MVDIRDIKILEILQKNGRSTASDIAKEVDLSIPAVGERIKKHIEKKSFFTKKFSKIRLVYCEMYKTEQNAAKREKQLKGWSRTKKQMLINGEIGFLFIYHISVALY